LQLCPDFVIELRSESDNLIDLQNKMAEYVENGARLGWLIDPKNKEVHIYRGGRMVEVLENPQRVSGENVLEGFELDLTEIW
jgi:Uma2 family endonuclease